MQNEYEVPFELTFNAESEVMNNLFVHDLTVQDEIVISDSKVKYLFENDVYIESTYKTVIVAISNEDKKEILSSNPNAVFEDVEDVYTTISSNRPFKLIFKTNVKPNDLGNSESVFSKVFINFS